MNKRLGLSDFDLNIEFKTENEAKKYAKRLKEAIRYICIKNKDKSYLAQVMIVVSNNRGDCGNVYYKHNGKVGRPKKERDYSKFDKSYYNNDFKVKWHLHILLVSMPMYQFREEIKKYLDKNWNIKDSDINYKSVYKKNVNINKAEYYIEQATYILFGNFNYSNNNVIPNEYTLKKLYNAYMKDRTSYKYIGDYIRNNNLEEKEKIGEEYENIKKYYYSLSYKEDKKAKDKYMKKVQMQKINLNYNNKLQKIN